MATESERIIEHLRRLTLHDAGIGDGRLLERFALHKDEAAFAALVRRHGPMVLGVCRRILGNHHDAEDAFQATFLVLVRKSASVTPKETVANWLYGVAFRTALKAKSQAAKLRVREQRAARLHAVQADSHDFPGELQSVLDQELNRLSEKHRAAFVLCDLEGKTHQEAARQLGCPEGTLSVRLMRAKKLLAKRLSRRGFEPSIGSLAVLVSADAASASVPPSLIVSTVKAATAFAAGQAATGLISAEVAALTHGVLKAMFLTKLKIASVILLVAGITGLGIRPLADVLLAGGKDGKQSSVRPKGNEAPPKDERAGADQKTDLDRIQGSWQVTKRERLGVAASEDSVKNLKYVFKGNELTVFEGDKYGGKVSFILDPAKKPKTIEMTVIEGGMDKGKTMYGIYRIEEDVLMACVGEKRPTEFSGAGEAGLMHFKRIDAHKTDLDRLQGSWRLVKQVVKGVVAGEGLVHTFKGNEITAYTADKLILAATFTLDPDKKPKAIELNVIDGSGKSTTRYGIYRLEEDALDLCFADERPTNFFGTDKNLLMQFKRVADDTPPIGRENGKDRKTPADAPKDQGAQTANAKIRGLMKERVEALQWLVHMRIEQWKAGLQTLDSFIEVQRLLLAADLEFAETDEERLACLERNRKLALQVKAHHEAAFKAGANGPAQTYLVVAFCLEVEIAYEKAKAATARKHDGKQ